MDGIYQDKTLTCVECETSFAFTSYEQAFYQTKGFTEPRRCPGCRAARKAASGERSGWDGRDSYSGHSSGPREFFTATCSDCGNQAKVPFAPTSGKPVYCSACFELRRSR